MAERLTDKNHEAINKCGEFSSCYSCRKEVCYITQICEKLGQLEDILEKYDLEVEELDERIYNCAFNYIDKLRAETDRDTWKRACELACEKLADIYSHCEYELFGDSVDEYRKYCEENGNPLQNIRYCETKYFYQQAKKEGE